NGNANDASGNGLNGTVNGSTLTTDRFGNSNSAYSFNGTSNSITVNSFPQSWVSGNFTISLWLNNAGSIGVRTYNGFISMGTTMPNQTFNFGYDRTNSNFSYYDVSNSSYFFTNGASELASKWANITILYNNGTITNFVNGVARGSRIASSIVPNSSNVLNIGAFTPDLQYFYGSIDDVTIYNRALTNCEISQLAGINPATISGQTVACSGGALTLTANPGSGFTYLWNDGSTSRTFTATSSGLYTTTVTQISGSCTATATANVAIAPKVSICMNISSGGSTIFKSNGYKTVNRCPGSVNIQAVNCTGTLTGATYKWYRVRISTGAKLQIFSSQSINLASIDSTFYYYVEVTSSPFGCTQVSYDTVRLKSFNTSFGQYISGRNLSTGKKDSLFIFGCPADTIALTAYNSGGYTNFTWRISSLGSPSVTGISGSVYKFNPTANLVDNYYVTFISSDGCPISSSIQVQGKIPKTFVFQPVVNTCSSDQTLFSINTDVDNGFYSNGSQTDSLYWNFGDPLSGVENYKGYTTNQAIHSFAKGGVYTVTGILKKLSYINATDICVTVQDMIVTINQKPKVDITLDTVKLCPGNSGATLFVTGTLGGSPYNFVWKGPGGVNNQTASNVNFSPPSIGNFTVFASITSDAFGCSSFNVDSVKVLNSNNPVVNIVAPVGRDTLCPNSPITLTSVGTGNLTHVWSSTPTDPSLSASGKFADIVPSTTTVYIDTVTDNITSCKAANFKTVYISNIVLSPITTSNFKPYCYSATIPAVLQTDISGVNSKPYTFVWSVNPVIGNLLTNTVVSNIPSGTVSTLPSNAQTTYTYTVSATDKFNCPATSTSTATFVLVVQPIPTYTIGSDNVLQICYLNFKKPSTATVSGGTPPYQNYVWTTSGISGVSSPTTDVQPSIQALTQSGNTVYSAYAVDANGCQSIPDQLTVVGNALPNVSISPASLKGCVGTPLSVSISNSNSGNTILWKNNGNIVQTNGLSYNVNANGQYRVCITIPSGAFCSDSSALVPASFINPPSGTLSLTPSVTSPCSYTVLKLWASNYVGDSLTYAWSTSGGGGTLLNTTRDTATYLAAALDGKVNFTYTISNRCGVRTSPANQITYLPTPVAILNTSSPETFLNKPMVFTNNSLNTDRPAILYLGNGSVTSAFAVNTPLPYQYSEQGDYIVKMKIINLNGCSDSTSTTIGVIGTKTVFIPNVFSPNANDNDNKTLRVFGTNILSQDFQMVVFNRWGQKVYESSNFDEANSKGWDGSVQSALQSPGEGVYTYSVKGKFVDGSPFERVGTVTLMR
ncbi:MAG: gliding motility-associated C-terminal domain-containing protein, partial [Cytophagales bacterium]|nr:gliding motility-associated C-terminal domain-containing protein [Cytophagales bacterium]